LYGPFYKWALPRIPNLTYQSTHISGQLINMIVFALVLSLIPWSIFIVRKYGQVTSGKNRMLSILVILLFTWFGLYARQQWIKFQSERIGQSDITYLLNPAEIKFEYYMLGGMVAGSAIAFLIFRKWN
jgi:hypothetical protein